MLDDKYVVMRKTNKNVDIIFERFEGKKVRQNWSKKVMNVYHCSENVSYVTIS